MSSMDFGGFSFPRSEMASRVLAALTAEAKRVATASCEEVEYGSGEEISCVTRRALPVRHAAGATRRLIVKEEGATCRFGRQRLRTYEIYELNLGN
jgi:hypothetical protein